MILFNNLCVIDTNSVPSHQVTQGVNYKAPPTPKCSFVDCGIKCTNPAVPLTKHCTKHVLNVKILPYLKLSD